VKRKIERRMLEIDDLLVFACTEGYLSELDRLRDSMRKLKRRWPRVYRDLFYGIHREDELIYTFAGKQPDVRVKP
jgi:hypothetical protein